jgi:geranylgeranyl pyrophosphate synthase
VPSSKIKPLNILFNLFQVSEIGYIVQMLHNASLLVDDIEDSSILRRGIPVAHKVKHK